MLYRNGRLFILFDGDSVDDNNLFKSALKK